MEALDKAISICDAEWKNDRKLWEHYKKHGKEVGASSKREYKNKSEALSNTAPGGGTVRLETNRGTITYKESSGEAAIYKGNEMKSYYKLRKAQVENEKKNAKKVEDRQKHK